MNQPDPAEIENVLQISPNQVDSTYRKLRQLSREIEKGDSIDNMTHSAHKALSFFRDIFPVAWWKENDIGGEWRNRKVDWCSEYRPSRLHPGQCAICEAPEAAHA